MDLAFWGYEVGFLFPRGRFDPQRRFRCWCRPPWVIPPVPPWTTTVDARLAIPTDVTIDIIPTFITVNQWSFTANVCLEPTGAARQADVFMAYTVDDYPDTYPYRYRKNMRWLFGPEAVDLVPGECVEVETTFNFNSVALDRWPGTEVVAWAQTPVSGWGEVYQAAKLSMTLHGDGFESGDFGGGWIVVP